MAAPATPSRTEPEMSRASPGWSSPAVTSSSEAPSGTVTRRGARTRGPESAATRWNQGCPVANCRPREITSWKPTSQTSPLSMYGVEEVDVGAGQTGRVRPREGGAPHVRQILEGGPGVRVRAQVDRGDATQRAQAERER